MADFNSSESYQNLMDKKYAEQYLSSRLTPDYGGTKVGYTETMKEYNRARKNIGQLND